MSSAASPTEQVSLAGKYLTFALSEEQYGLHILKVQEIIGVMHVTKVPSCAPYLKGVVNLRGKIIPIVDLRLKFGIEPIPYDAKTCIVVVDVELHSKKISVGIVVDTVLEVVNLAHEKIESAPEYGVNLSTQFITGMGRTHEDTVVILIDIDKALSDAADIEIVDTRAS